MIAGSNLEQVLRSGNFAVTGELGPPKSGDFEVVRKKARILKGHVDAVNITDCQTAIVRMSSFAAGLLALSEGVEPVMQMTCRDRNRIGIQADILGASALGIKNLLCLTGDHQKFGNHPQAKGVFDMDSIQLLGMVKQMRDEKRFQCGEEIKSNEPELFLGAAANPFADPFEYRPIRLGKKVAAGANFIQTQIIYNVEKFAKFMEMVRDLGLHEKVFILAGVTPPKSLGMARYMKRFVPGLDVTDEVIDRLSDAKDQREEGINICVDIVNRVKEIEGVSGVHIMAIEWEEAVPEIVKRAGLGPRPEPQGIEPRLVSTAAIEEAVERARHEVRDEIEKELKKARSEAEASRGLLIKEKEKASSEIAGLRKELEEMKDSAARHAAEVKRLTAELEETKEKLQQAGPLEAAVGEAVGRPASTSHTGFDQGTMTEGISSGKLSPREQEALSSLNLGLKALQRVLGLNEDQFEALRRFLEAEFLLQLGQVAQPVTTAAVTPPPVEVPVAEASEEAREAETRETAVRRQKEVVNLVAKANVLLHKNKVEEALNAFKEALEIAPEDEKALEGLNKAKALLAEKEAGPAEAKEEAIPPAEGLPPCPEEFTPEEWSRKWVVRYVAMGNVRLMKGDNDGAIEAFKKALELDPGDEKAKEGLERAKTGKGIHVPEVSAEKAAAEVKEPAPEEKKEAPPTEVKVVEEKAPEVEEAAPKEEKKEAEEAPRPAPRAKLSGAPEHEGVGSLEVPGLEKETRSLAERAGSISEDLYKEPCSGSIKDVIIGDGEKAIAVGGETTLPFYLFEGDMPNPPRVAFEVLDSRPEEWPDVLTRYFDDCLDDPVKWARKCVDEFNAKAVCLSLISTDPNGADAPASDAAKIAKEVVEGVDVPVILWGCGNADKDTETLREVTSLIGNKKVCVGPLSDANYRTLGATAMAFQLPVVASTPIDVNLAKQLNILLENLGVSLNHILMDPSIGAVGYGLEYTYSVMERIRLAALTQQDEKLSAPIVANLGREVWKAKECRLPSDVLLGDQERRGVIMEAVTASTLLLAGGEIMIMRHPKAVALTEALIEGLM